MMYLHAGRDTVIRTKSIVAVFDLDYASQNKDTLDFLKRAEKEKRLINVTDELPKLETLAAYAADPPALPEELIKRVLTVRARLAPYDLTRRVVDPMILAVDALAVAFHIALLEVRGKTAQILVVG